MKRNLGLIGGAMALLLVGLVSWQVIETFDSAEEEQILACSKDLLTCSDGSTVSRGGFDCSFAECPDFEVPGESNPVPSPSVPRKPIPTAPEEPVACTMDAKQCPDGSYVGRVAPDCAFAECPGPVEKGGSITCSPESKLAEVCAEIYAPVCGLVEIQCITTPCDPIPQTYSNSCSACRESNVNSYTKGTCEQ